MTPPTFPPADLCSPEDLLAICEAVARDPALSYDLAGSREHIEALCRWAVRQAQYLSEAHEERDDLKVRDACHEAARVRLGDLAADLLDGAALVTADLDAARTEIWALQSTLDHERNERQGEVLELDIQRERADQAEAALAEHRQTAAANDRIQSALSRTCEAVTGKTIEQVNLELDEELAANPDLGPLHHARDMREGDTTP